MNQILGQKTKQGQKFLENGNRIPVTYVSVAGNVVVSLKTSEKDKYNAIQMGMGQRKKANKTHLGHAKKASLSEAPYFIREERLGSEVDSLPELGSQIKASEVFTPGDMVEVIGTSKGKGFAGGVKRYGFHGGPKTHGQSDRHRAPGSIGQGTTPGRVYKGKRMAGRMGSEQVTVRNLKIMDVSDDQILLYGLVPGVLGSYIVIRKTGEDKKFIPLYKEPVAADQAPAEETASEEPAQAVEEPVKEEAKTEEKAEEQSVEAEIKTESTEDKSVEENFEAKQEDSVQPENPTEEQKTEDAREEVENA